MSLIQRAIRRGIYLAVAGFLALSAGAYAQNLAKFTYDRVGRLVKVEMPDGVVKTYTYDATGNRTQATTESATWVGELVPDSYTASSNYGSSYTGLAGSGMRDGSGGSATTMHLTNADSPFSWIMATLPLTKKIQRVDFLAPTGFVANLNGAVVEYSLTGSSGDWKAAGVVSDATTAGYKSVFMSGVPAKYIRIVKSGDYVATGDMRIYGGTPPNGAPMALDDIIQTPTATTKTFDPRENDTDPDGDTFTIDTVTQPASGQGSVSISSGGVGLTYDPQSFYGTTAFTYTVIDSNGLTALASVVAKVGSGTSAPVANQDTALTEKGMAIKIHPLWNDTAEPTYTLTIQGATQPGGGTATGVVAVADSGTSLTFTPNANYTGQTYFTYTINDGHSGTATNYVTVTVIPLGPNGGEITSGISFTASSNWQSTFTALSNPATMRDLSDTAASSAHGTSGEANNWIQADLGSVKTIGRVDILPIATTCCGGWGPKNVETAGIQTSTDGSTWTEQGVFGLTRASGATMDLNVSARYVRLWQPFPIESGVGDFRISGTSFGVPVNHRPLATTDSFTVEGNSTAVLHPEDNDYDPDGEAVYVLGAPTIASGDGVATRNWRGVLYAPPSGFTGTKSFKYTLMDSNGYGRALGTVNLTVTAPTPDGVEFTSGLTFSASSYYDPAYTGLTTANGMRDGLNNANNTVYLTSYSGSEWIQVDLGSAKPVHRIKVLPINTSFGGWGPSYANDAEVQYSTNGVSWEFAGTLANATDTTPASMNIDATARYIRLANSMMPIGVGEFRIYGPNHAPVASADAKTTTAHTAITFDPRVNDADVDGDSLTVTSVTQPSSGTGSVTTNGSTVTYNPNGYVGSTTFSYTITDSHSATSTATVALTVGAGTTGAEITSGLTFSASSNYSAYSGLTTTNAMRDGVINTAASVHGTDLYDGWTLEWIMVDLGSAKAGVRIELRPIANALDGWGVLYLNNATVEYSTDGSTWTSAGTVTSTSESTYSQVPINASVRYIRVLHPWLGLGDFRIYDPDT